MPSPLGHAIAGVAAGWLVAGAPRTIAAPWRVREALLFAGLGMLPDLDLLFGMHSGPTHSVGASLVIGAAAFATAVVRSVPRPGRIALACLAAYASHVLLDWLGTDASPPLGIMALWPFDRGYYESDLHLFMAISRRYYQGWTFVEQNVRAMAHELLLLVPLTVLVFWTRRPRSVVGPLVLTAAILSHAAPAAAQPTMLPVAPKAEAIDLRAFDALVAGYRKGDIALSVERLTALLSTREGQRRLSEWIEAARKQSRRVEIETLLLLVSDKIMEIWAADDPFPERLLPPYQAALRQAHFTLMDIKRGTPFLRAWYLLWESFRQSNMSRQLPRPLDFLDDALAEFPRDAEMLLAAGARQELYWTASLENVQRSLSTQPLDVTRLLTAARDFFRRSLTADPKETESRVRLLHVLLELDDLTPMQDVIASHDWTQDDRTFRYLANLFEGDMHERKRDFTAATAAYERASRFTENPQSARVAKAHVAHLQGQRTEAAAIVEQALTDASDRDDPWALFIHGVSWRFDAYKQAARALVMP